MLLLMFTELVTMQTFGVVSAAYGNQNVEQWTGIIGGDMVQAYVLVTVNKPTVIQSISMYLQYSGSDGSQCIKFGIYMDNGNGSPAGQALVAATQNSYCLRGSGSWGPAWQTWKLRPSDYLTINASGDYWLSTLAKQTYGTIYHYSYSQNYDYTYGYANYFFTTPYDQGFPTAFSSNPAWESNAPYSFYVTGT